MSSANKLVLRSCVVTVNGVDLSDHCASVEVILKKASVDTTNFGGQGKEQVQGLEEDSFVLEFQQDYSTSEVDQTLWPLYLNGTEFVVTVQPSVGARSLTNPTYSATCILMDYTPISGKVGTLASIKQTIPVQRNTFARLTS